MNEATLEAMLHSVLESVFPTFKEMEVIHQQSFSIKFGRHNVKVDLKDPSTYPNRAIFDILLKAGNVNLILTELKRKGHEIVQDDIDQGLSYARLIHPMPPIVLISNGTKNLLFDTYTKQPLDVSTIDMAYINARINLTFELAMSEFKNAVSLLLNKDSQFVGKIINKISKENFDLQTGDLSDYSKTICASFQINRRIVQRMHKLISKKGKVIGLIGQAFSGKTNVLYQFFRNFGYKKDHYILYLDLKDSNFSIFQTLAQAFSVETKTHITKEKIRDWFNSMLYNNQTKFILLIDNLNKSIPEELYSEFLELMRLFKDSQHSIIYSIDEWSYENIAHQSDRIYKNVIGNFTNKLYLKELNEIEFTRVNKVLYKHTNSIIQFGGQHCLQYRHPRILRTIAILYKNRPLESHQYFKIEAIADLDLINQIAINPIFDNAIHDYFQKIAIAFYSDKTSRKVSLVTKSLGAFSRNSYIKLYGQGGYDKLIKSALVTEREYQNKLFVVIPKVPELLVYHAINVIDGIVTKAAQEENPNLYELFLNACSKYPSGDIIGAGVIIKIGNQNSDVFSYLIQELLNSSPKKEIIKKGTEVMLFSEKAGLIRMRFASDMEEESFAVMHLPYSVLSHLFTKPMQGENKDGTIGYDPFIEALYQLGSTPEIIFGDHLGSFDNIKPFLYSTIPEVGTFLSGKNGIVEMLVQSFQKCFMIKPLVIEKLYERAKNDLNYHLLWRIYLACVSCTNVVDAERANTAALLCAEIKSIFFKLITEKISGKVS